MMPELANRKRSEASLAGAAYLLFMQQRPQVVSGFFDPTQFIDAWRDLIAKRIEEIHAKAYAKLADLYDIEAEATKLSRRYAIAATDKLGEEIAAGLVAKIQRAKKDAEDEEQRKDMTDDIVRKWLRRSRAITIATTETTAAVSRGEYDAVQRIRRERGIILKPRWFTSGLENVCPICLPYEDMPAVIWRRRFPFGPPAHPSCNCYLEYDAED